MNSNLIEEKSKFGIGSGFPSSEDRDPSDFWKVFVGSVFIILFFVIMYLWR